MHKPTLIFSAGMALVTATLLAPVLFFSVLWLAGPHGGALPTAMQPLVLGLAWAVWIATPVIVAVRCYRRRASARQHVD